MEDFRTMEDRCCTQDCSNGARDENVRDLGSQWSESTGFGPNPVRSSRARSNNNYLMKPNEFSNSQHLCMITCSAGIKTLNDRRNITKDAGVHQSWSVRENSQSFSGNLISRILTSNQHDANSENLFRIGIGCNITEADRRQWRECEIKSRYIARL